MNPNEQEDLDSWQERREQCRERHGNNGFGVPLGIAVRLWPTARANGYTGSNTHGEGGPDLQTAVSDQWRTPNAYDGQQRHNAVSTEHRIEAGKTISLGMQVSLEARGLLNPAWVELLQGFPPGWTDIPAGPPDRGKRSTATSRRERPAGVSPTG
jgi:hypothetical protein